MLVEDENGRDRHHTVMPTGLRQGLTDLARQAGYQPEPPVTFGAAIDFIFDLQSCLGVGDLPWARGRRAYPVLQSPMLTTRRTE